MSMLMLIGGLCLKMQIQELEMDKSEECTQEVALKFGDAATW